VFLGDCHNGQSDWGFGGSWEGQQKLHGTCMRKKLYIDYTKVCRTPTHHLCLIPAEKGEKPWTGIPPLFLAVEQGMHEISKEPLSQNTLLFFLFFLLLSLLHFLPEVPFLIPAILDGKRLEKVSGSAMAVRNQTIHRRQPLTVMGKRKSLVT